MDDLISRQATIDLWDKYHPYIAIKAMEYDRELRALPSTQPERKKGKWIPGREVAREYCPFYNKLDKYSPNMQCNIIYENYKCSSCGLTIDRLLYDWKGEPFYKFCPNCGADMQEEKTNENR